MENRKRRFLDRYDGRPIRTLDPFYKIIPYIMKTRVDAQNLFEDKIDIDKTEEFLKAKRHNGIKNIGFLHIVIAAMVRTISQKPGLNRFIAGQKIFARNEILISLTLKKQLSLESTESTETTVKLKFEPTDTLSDVVSKVNEAVATNKKVNESNDTDKAARIFMKCPGMFVKFLVWVVKTLDYFGLMPKVLNRVSPFHTSVFVTDLGSLGIQPVYHHLYEFGTTSIFIAFGSKFREKHIDKGNNFVEKKYVSFKVVTDERTVDGPYYAAAFRQFKTFIQHPERLEVPPNQVFDDIE